MPAGRPTKYTQEIVAAIIRAIELGSTYELACNGVGISHETFCEWRRRYPEFLEAVKEAEGRGVANWLAQIETAANNGNWQAAAWKLERRYPHSYGRRDRMPIDERELQRQFEAEMARIEAGGETSLSPGPASEAIN